MHIGRLDRQVQIQTATVTRGPDGMEIKAWTTVHTLWARVEPQSGGETFEASRRSAKQSVKFTTRFVAGIEPRMRLVHDGQVHEITDVAEVGRRLGLLLTCEVFEKSAGGV